MLIACPACQTTNRVPAERLADAPDCGRCGTPLLNGAVVELTDANFDAVTAKTELPVVVDFWAAWCGPCQAMAPQFKHAAEHLKGQALLVKVNSDQNPKTAARFGIRSIPTLVKLDRGTEAKRVSGAMSATQLVQWVRSV